MFLIVQWKVFSGKLQGMRVDGRERDEVQDGLGTGVNIDGKCPVMEVLRCSVIGEEGGLVVAVPQEHGVFEGVVAGDPLIIEQRADVVRGVKTVDPALPAKPPVIPSTAFQLAPLQKDHGFVGQGKILLVFPQAAYARQKNGGQRAAVVDLRFVPRRIAETEFFPGLKGAIQAGSQKAGHRLGNLQSLRVSEDFVHLHHCRPAKVGRDTVRGKRRQARTAERDVVPVVAPAVFRFMRRTEPNQLVLEPGGLGGDVVTGLRQIAICRKAKTQSLGVAARGDFQGLAKSQTGETLAGLYKKNRG